jgi:hypothetical protein
VEVREVGHRVAGGERGDQRLGERRRGHETSRGAIALIIS